MRNLKNTKNANDSFVIASAFRKKLSFEENVDRDQECFYILSDERFVFKTTLGAWEGNEEYSFVIKLVAPEDLDRLKALFLVQFEQEYILLYRPGIVTEEYLFGAKVVGTEITMQGRQDGQVYTELNGVRYVVK